MKNTIIIVEEDGVELWRENAFVTRELQDVYPEPRGYHTKDGFFQIHVTEGQGL